MTDLFDPKPQQFPPLPKPKDLRRAYLSTTQPTYRDPDPTIRKSGNPPTSQEAHRSVSDQQREGIRSKIVTQVGRDSLGMTCDEVEQWLELSHQTASARITELLKSGEICVKTIGGIAMRQLTRSGRSARVYTTLSWQRVRGEA